MKRTIEEEKRKILAMMESMAGLSILGSIQNQAVEHIKAIREAIALDMSDDDFRNLIMSALDNVLSGNELESPIDSDVNAIEDESSDDMNKPI
jgi:hypothetical protein